MAYHGTLHFLYHLCEAVSIDILAFALQPTAAITGEGLKEAFEWVAMIVDRAKRGNTKIEYRSTEADAF